MRESLLNNLLTTIGRLSLNSNNFDRSILYGSPLNSSDEAFFEWDLSFIEACIVAQCQLDSLEKEHALYFAGTMSEYKNIFFGSQFQSIERKLAAAKIIYHIKNKYPTSLINNKKLIFSFIFQLDTDTVDDVDTKIDNLFKSYCNLNLKIDDTSEIRYYQKAILKHGYKRNDVNNYIQYRKNGLTDAEANYAILLLKNNKQLIAELLKKANLLEFFCSSSNSFQLNRKIAITIKLLHFINQQYPDHNHTLIAMLSFHWENLHSCCDLTNDAVDTMLNKLLSRDLYKMEFCNQAIVEKYRYILFETIEKKTSRNEMANYMSDGYNLQQAYKLAYELVNSAKEKAALMNLSPSQFNYYEEARNKSFSIPEAVLYAQHRSEGKIELQAEFLTKPTVHNWFRLHKAVAIIFSPTIIGALIIFICALITKAQVKASTKQLKHITNSTYSMNNSSSFWHNSSKNSSATTCHTEAKDTSRPQTQSTTSATI